MSEDQVRYGKDTTDCDQTESLSGQAAHRGARVNKPYPDAISRHPPGEPIYHNKWRDVTITKVANGFIVHVGCKIFVANTWAQVSDGLIYYWDDPETAEKKYRMG